MSDDDKIQPNDVPLIGAENITDPNTGNRMPIVKDWQTTVKPGDIVQLSPTDTETTGFAACLLVVTDVYGWGVQGYVQSLGDRETMGGLAYYRAEWATIEPTGGKAVWLAEGPE